MKKSGSITKILGRRVRERRLEMGLSQEAFADKCGIDRTYISGIERGIRNPTLVVLYAISEGLNTELSQLFMFSE
ncbi:helix-turn-helix transcriptional regulator [Salmonella enterica subsp. enterica serovar Newport]|uniref:XRE family transcriptional regulator n=1 Tax=Salmonella newport TaxID=108619 RepID=A0A5U9KX61_SALNE|nr:XRE family transcriptional regulator [Salmonella enterica]EBS2695784.1 XRE family transcriptional regulator [Salmonella enterica subsp. enterica serovar Newport]ECC9940461.1 XRE family transcriptional regulator [Salmonella enterica subsp. enterica]ECJ2492349.1 helix-turn-helix transcriptional regulator [Salmonella enterica subsp. diarizonae]ECP8567577.1 helix-turn-helix transcriptional regulator [Salmonella enterica subsp. enterica serovar Java]ECU9998790.1 XRE family transcriptional regula